MANPPVSRRQFIATGSALVAGPPYPTGPTRFSPARPPQTTTPGAPKPPRPRWRARPRWARLRRHPRQPLSPRIDRDARAAGAERVPVDELRHGAARARQRRVGLRRHQPRRSGRGARGRRTGYRDRPRQRPPDHAEGRARQCRQGRDLVDQPDQTRSVRGAARNQDRVPDEAERNRDGGAGRQLRQLADPVRRRAEVLRLERRVAHHPAAGAHLSAVHDHRRRSRQRRFQTRAVVDRAKLARLRIRRGLSVAAGRREGRPRGGREAQSQARRPRAATTSSSIRRSCSSPSTNRSATRPSSIARSAGKPTWPAPAS